MSIPNLQQFSAASVFAWFGRDRAAGQAMWVTFPFAIQQLIRLAQNIVLARLLAPEMFGVMLLINTLRTGTELLSDIGIGQSIVTSPRGEEKRFLDTAWTLQLLRGLLLAAVMIAAAAPIAAIYKQPELVSILMVVSSIFVFTGLQSPGLFLAQKQMRLRARSAYDLGCATFQAGFTIALAAVMPSVWALVWGLVVSALFSMTMTYALGRGYRPALAWDKSAAREIFHFGKWIFLSTIIYFGATSSDNIYFVAVLPLALAGVYSIARTFAGLFDELGSRVGSMLLFPKFAALGERRVEAAARLRSRRRLVLALAALTIGGGMAASDLLIRLLYDSRYHLAGFMLPLLLAGAWFRMLGSFGDAMLMGSSRPAPGAFANGTKFAVLVVGLPLALSQANVFAALLVLIVAEAGRWAVLAFVLQRERLAAIIDDVGLTVLMVGSALALKLLAGAVGFAPTFTEWWSLGEALRG